MNNENKLRPIRSYVRREGRMTHAQKQALEELWALYGINFSEKSLDLNNLFNRSNDKVLEIGFGTGESLVKIANAHPEKDFIGVDVHRPGVGALLLNIKKYNLTNVRVISHDAVEVLDTQIQNESLAAVYIFFPDPWPKKRHHKRRLIKPDFVELVRAKLKIGGCIHLATDWQNYAEQMMMVMSSAPGFINLSGQGNYAPRPSYRPETKFEKRGMKLGHKVWDLIFIKEF